MAEPFVLSFVEKLLLLEDKAGQHTHYRLFPPIREALEDDIAIQRVARQVAEWVGLPQYTWVVGFMKQAPNVAGHIEPRTVGSDVFIEINSDLREVPASIGPTLCHEIAHKWLQDHGIVLPLERENEILTDIATVFLGLGKVMLNGCEVKTRIEKTVNSELVSSERTLTCGYLKRDQMAFAYRLVCSMRRIPKTEYVKDLSPEAAAAVGAWEGSYLDPALNTPAAVLEAARSATAKLNDYQGDLARLSKHLKYVRDSFCKTIDATFESGHRNIRKLSEDLPDVAADPAHDPVLNYLRSIKHVDRIERILAEVAQHRSAATILLSHAHEVGQVIARNKAAFPQPALDTFVLIKCPIDGTTLRLPPDKPSLQVTCPRCRYSFEYDTTLLKYAAPTWWSRLRSLFRQKLEVGAGSRSGNGEPSS